MILDRYLTKQFVPVFVVSSSMFVLLLAMIDLFTNLARYLNNEVAPKDVFRVTMFYLPKGFSYALPISLLFAVAYILGELYARNELTSVFAAGIPFWRFSIALLIIGFAASIFSFFFDDLVVIPTLKMKNDLSRVLLNEQRSQFQADVVVKTNSGQLIYAADYYDSIGKVLHGLSIIEQDGNGGLVNLVRAQRASWSDDHWALTNSVIYEWENGFLKYRVFGGSDKYREDPDTFRRSMVNIEELHFFDARLLVNDLKLAGLPYTNALADFHHRFSFSTVSFIVVALSISMGGRFRKNIMLMSLLSSLGSAVVFYIIERTSMMMAKLGYIPPFIGAWFPVFIFIIAAFFLLKTAKT